MFKWKKNIDNISITPSSYIKTPVSQGIKCYRKHCIIPHKGCILYNTTLTMIHISANSLRQCSPRSNPSTPQTSQEQSHRSTPPPPHPPPKNKKFELAFTVVTMKLEMLELVLVSSPELWPIHYHWLCDKEMRNIFFIVYAFEVGSWPISPCQSLLTMICFTKYQRFF